MINLLSKAEHVTPLNLSAFDRKKMDSDDSSGIRQLRSCNLVFRHKPMKNEQNSLLNTLSRL